MHLSCSTAFAEEEGCSRPGTEGESAAASCAERAKEPLHLGHGVDVLLHLCRQTGCHFMVCVLLDEGKQTFMMPIPEISHNKHMCSGAAQ